MGKVKNKKFYRPGTLEVKGTKLSLKTQPYTNGIIFNPNDPITSFHQYISMMKVIVDEYESFIGIAGMRDVMQNLGYGELSSGDIAKVKLLLNFLAQSPIEILLKEQIVTNDILATIETTYE